MAYELKYQDLLGEPTLKDEEDTTTLAAIPEAAPATGDATPAAPAPAAPAGGDSGGKFVNFDRYLAANQSDAAALGGKIADDVGTQAATAQTNVTDSGEKFRQGLQDMEDATPNKPPRPPAGQPGATTAAGTNTVPAPPPPRPPAPAPRGETRIGGVTADELGLTDWRSKPEYEGLSGGITAAATRVRNLGDAGGRQELVRGQVAKDNVGKNYTAGQNRFDTALVGGAAGDKLEGVRSKYGNLEQWLNSYGTQLGRQTDFTRQYVDQAADRYNQAEQAQMAARDAANAERQRLAAEETARAAAEAAKYQKPQSFADYRKNRALDYVRASGNTFDPVSWITNAAGERSPIDWATGAMESAFGIPEDQRSNRTREFQEGDEDVYNSMTADELAYLEGLRTPQLQRAWIEARRKQLRGE